MNELQLFLRNDPAYAQGFRTIIATEGGQHEYVANWWPPGTSLATSTSSTMPWLTS
jgi:hypothetical protein